MAQQMQTRKPRQASPERWQRAVRRAIAENIEVRQVNATGMWTASSGSDPKLAYVLEVVAGVVRACSCPAGEYGDPCCKHAARYYLDAGLLDPEPEGSPPASAVAPVVCFRCRRTDALCPICAGAGLADLAAQATALVAAAQAAEGRSAMVAEPEPAPFDSDAESEHVSRAGHVAGYDVLTVGDSLLVAHAASGADWRHVVANFGTALADLGRAPGLRLGWARFPDAAEAIYCYDAEDGNFGYAFNLADPALSEWGYAPFATEDPRSCDGCGVPLDDETVTDDATGQALCAECVDQMHREAERTLADAIAEAHRNDAWERAQLAA